MFGPKPLKNTFFWANLAGLNGPYSLVSKVWLVVTQEVTLRRLL
jgi:hypothetical protein